MDAPAVAVSNDGKFLAVAWMDMRQGRDNRNVYWTLGSGGKFSPEATVHDGTRGYHGHPSLVIDTDGVAWCAWEDERGGQQAVYAANSKTKKNMRVSDESEGKGAFPWLVAGGGLVGVIYEAGDSAHFRILARK